MQQSIIQEITKRFSSAKTLQISYIGMQTQEVAIEPNLRVRLKPDTKTLDDVIVIGYGTVKKSELTGAISSVKADEINRIPVVNVSQALQGKVSGLQIVSTSGRAGDETQISLRGNGSLQASNEVLYVIDGIPGAPFSSISPNDIESIEVLKDAASTAIYGSRASNGVILITTKSGAYGKKTQVTLNASFGIQNPVKTSKLLNATQYGEILNEARQNFQDDIANGFQDAPKDPDMLTAFTPLSENGTNWMDEIRNKNAMMQNYQLGISGGGEKTKFYLGASHFSQEGTVKMDEYKRSTLKLNVDHMIFKNFKIGVKSYFSAAKSIPLDEDNSIYQPWVAANSARPDAPAYDEDGKPYIGTFTNPLHAFERQISDKNYKLGGSAYLDYTILEGLVWHASIGGGIKASYYKRYDSANTKRGESAKGSGAYTTGLYSDYTIENTLTYSNRVFDKLFYTVLAGHSFQKFAEEESEVYGQDFSSTELTWLDSAGKITDGKSTYTASALESYFGRIQLNWNDKYNLMLSVRTDGSSRFSSENRWGTFFAISGGWTISNEAFWNKDIINVLKLRASYGQTGNQSGISNSSGLNLISSAGNYDGAPALAVKKMYNKDLTWEKGLATNFGLDISFLQNKINLSINYYNKKTKDLLYNAPVGTESGFRIMTKNIGNIRNNGIELDLNAKIFNTKDFSWDFNTNFSYNKNKVLDLGDPIKNYYNTGFISIIKEGEPLGSFQLIKSLGVAQEVTEYKNKEGKVIKTVQPGDMLYEDVNKDGEITSADAQIFNGGIAPIYGGFGTMLTYKGFDLNIQAQYSIGKKIYTMYKEGGNGQMNGGAGGYPKYSANMLTDILNRWTPDNRDTDVPRLNLGTATATWNTQQSSRFLEDADYLRIADITLGYNFKSSKIPYIETLRVYAQVRNPFTWTNYSGLDPELQYIDRERTDNKVIAGTDQGGIPNMRSFIFGINISF